MSMVESPPTKHRPIMVYQTGDHNFMRTMERIGNMQSYLRDLDFDAKLSDPSLL
jgi:hypothetical protein